jgi:hypothetical protein
LKRFFFDWLLSFFTLRFSLFVLKDAAKVRRYITLSKKIQGYRFTACESDLQVFAAIRKAVFTAGAGWGAAAGAKFLRERVPL